jgi:NAD(P)-dependent dehydrogenase (short-subunit alcohol dehydrogenase family)
VFLRQLPRSGSLRTSVGGAAGIGASTIRYLHEAGALIVFGDVQDNAAEALLSSLNNPSTITYIHTDVTKYADNIKLFKTALEKYGHVDHACPVAGIIESGRWFDPNLTIETVEKEESRMTIDVNLIGTAMFARIAVVYLKHDKKEEEDKSLTLISSAAGFRESPGLPLYQCSKHGVMGLMRTLRKQLYRGFGIRINCVNPGMTDTQMTEGIIEAFRKTKQPINTADDIAETILGEMTTEGFYGKAVYVEGGKNWEIEEGLDRTMPQWVGEEPARRIKEALAVVDKGDAWKVR